MIGSLVSSAVKKAMRPDFVDFVFGCLLGGAAFHLSGSGDIFLLLPFAVVGSLFFFVIRRIWKMILLLLAIRKAKGRIEKGADYLKRLMP
jgi:hypothetical protein